MHSNILDMNLEYSRYDAEEVVCSENVASNAACFEFDEYF